MKKLFSAGLGLLAAMAINAQEIFSTVVINNDKVSSSNTQVFRTLEQSIRDFVNTTSWSGRNLDQYEKIKCNFSIIINEVAGSRYKASLVVQAMRPVYKSMYESPLINFNDVNFEFEYSENENLVFNERQFSGKNLTDVMCFYVYYILGLDADSFNIKAGQEFFTKANQIAQNAANQDFKGWSQRDGFRSRANIITQTLAEQNTGLRTIFSNYHRYGIDYLSYNDTEGKRKMAKQLLEFKNYLNDFQMNAYFTLFLESKREEIFNIYNYQPNDGVNINELKQLFNQLSPKNAEEYWSKWK
jgi:Domain of unknown function (DUF4835)